MSTKIFNKPRPQELLTNKPSHGGSYRMDQSTELILEARKRKRQAGSDSSNLGSFILEAIALAVSVALAAFLLMWIVCAGNEPKASSLAFCGAMWSFGGLMALCGMILVRKR